MLEPDTVVLGRYRLVRPLNCNPSRQTWLARDGEELVVLKVLASGVQWDDFKLFEREAQTLRQLTHPCIPRYRDYFRLDEEQAWFALVQEYIPAPSLKECLIQGMRFDEAQFYSLATGVLDILCYLHALNPPVLHRDIKPSNLLLAEDRRVYLIDFGAAQNQAAAAGHSFTVVGTYGYTPMEQFGGRAVPASDLYALGATLIHLATGSVPADLPQLDLRISFQDRTSLAPALVRWLERMTEPAPERRFPSARAALEALAEARDGTAAPHPTEPWRCRHLLDAHRDIVHGLAFGAGGSVLATASWDRTVRLWSTAHGELLRVLTGHRSRVLCVAFADDGRTLLSAGADRLVGVWEWESGRLKRMLKGPAEPVLAAHGRLLALAGDGRVAIWDLGSETFRDFPCSKPATGSPIALSDALLAFRNRENRVELYHLETGKLWKTLPEYSPYSGSPSTVKVPPDLLPSVVALAFSPDGRTLAIAVQKMLLPVLQPSPNPWNVQVDKFQPDQIYLWDVQADKLLRSMPGHGDHIHGIAFDQERLATGSGGQDRTIKFWDPGTGELMQTLAGHTGIVYSLAFSPDGRTLASGSGDGTARLWTNPSPF